MWKLKNAVPEIDLFTNNLIATDYGWKFISKLLSVVNSVIPKNEKLCNESYQN